MSIEIMKI